MSAKFAPVAPIHILEELQARDYRFLFGDYHLFLAHHTVEHPERFRKLVQSQLSRDPHRNLTIIMDNSLVELGGAVDDGMIRDAVNICYGTRRGSFEVIPVLPDVMGNGPDTVEASKDGYERWIEAKMPGDGFMLVTQGASWEEFCATVNYFFVENREEFRNIRWVGIPRVLVQAIGSRARAVQYVQMVAPHVQIHLLGFSGQIADDLFTARLPGVRGIDSAVPVRYPRILTPMTTDEEIGPRGDWWEHGQVTKNEATNIWAVRQWINTK